MTPDRSAVVRFADRVDAGRRLAAHLATLPSIAGLPSVADAPGLVVLGLPRGGVPVAARGRDRARRPARRDPRAQARRSVPARARDGRHRRGRRAGRQRGGRAATPASARRTSPRSRRVSARARAPRARRFRGDAARVSLAGRTALIVDDGIATGSTVRAACHVAARARSGTGRRGDAGRTAGHLGPAARRRGRGGGAREPRSVRRDRTVLRRLLADESTTRSWGSSNRARGGLPERDDEVVVRAGNAELGGPPAYPARRARGRVVRARQRQQPSQPAQPVRRRRPPPGGARHAALRPAHAGRGGRPDERVRQSSSSPAGSATRPSWLLDELAPADRRDRLLRREHGRGGGAVGRGRARRPGRARSCRAAAVPTSRGRVSGAVRAPTLLDRRGRRRAGPRAEPSRARAAARARRISSSCRTRPISSRSREHSNARPSSHATGSSST